jgi:hypothetical protein
VSSECRIRGLDPPRGADGVGDLQIPHLPLEFVDLPGSGHRSDAQLLADTGVLGYVGTGGPDGGVHKVGAAARFPGLPPVREDSAVPPGCSIVSAVRAKYARRRAPPAVQIRDQLGEVFPDVECEDYAKPGKAQQDKLFLK